MAHVMSSITPTTCTTYLLEMYVVISTIDSTCYDESEYVVVSARNLKVIRY